MDLMSSLRLLLCALAATLPGALGVSSVRVSEIKVNNSLLINQKLNRKILLNPNGPPLVKVVSELQSVFKDMACSNCTSCMERAIRADKIQSHVISHNRPNELYYYLVNNLRKKRNTVVPNELDRKIEKVKSTATVIRYTKEKKVLALEIKETDDDGRSICKVYGVKKSLPCDSRNDIISLKTKKTKKTKEKIPSFTQRVSVVTEKPKSISSAYKKRQVDNSQVLESFMPSIEELY